MFIIHELPENWRHRIVLPELYFKKLSIDTEVFKPTWQNYYFVTAIEIPHNNFTASVDDVLIFRTKSEFLTYFEKYRTWNSCAKFLVFDGENSKFAGYVHPTLTAYEALLNSFCKNLGTRFN